jgi:hypothetical protein
MALNEFDNLQARFDPKFPLSSSIRPFVVAIGLLTLVTWFNLILQPSIKSLYPLFIFLFELISFKENDNF